MTIWWDVMDGGARHDIISHDIVSTTAGVRFYNRGRSNRI